MRVAAAVALVTCGLLLSDCGGGASCKCSTGVCRDDGTCGPAGSGGGGGTTSGCGSAPEGAYKCSGSTLIQQCNAGSWVSAGSCGCSVKVGDPRKPAYSATCKTLIGTSNAIECSYADVDCKQCLPGQTCKTTCTKCATSTSSSCCP